MSRPAAAARIIYSSAGTKTSVISANNDDTLLMHLVHNATRNLAHLILAPNIGLVIFCPLLSNKMVFSSDRFLTH